MRPVHIGNKIQQEYPQWKFKSVSTFNREVKFIFHPDSGGEITLYFHVNQSDEEVEESIIQSLLQS